MKIIIESYNPAWKTAFEKEQALLLNAIKEPGLTIEHIGSTSVEGLGAKPIIDIMIGLKDFQTANTHLSAIENLGYVYLSKYEDEMPYRRFFFKEENGVRTHHIHMVALGTEFWDRHLQFRDHLRTHAHDRERYHALKMELAGNEWEHMNDYADAKTGFIRAIEQKTMS
ncbi:GrpB family protein [Rapidithrix thailandica]|uniref:GrpB family protein n=1 Tax=Rapidithrix thailandica TaxID=413964 RepID=A0AAW9SKT6_9BACT